MVGSLDVSTLAWGWRVGEHLYKTPDGESPPSAEVVQRSPHGLWCIPEHPQTSVAWLAKESPLSSSLVAVVDHDPPNIPTAFAGMRVHRLPAEGRVLQPADRATASAFSSPVDFRRCRAGDVEDAWLSAASAEHAIYSTSTEEPSGALPHPTMRCRIEKYAWFV